MKTAERYTEGGGWHVTGDAGSVDKDGAFSFSSHDDDAVIMAGSRIGPFEVKRVPATRPRVMEAAVIGAPDALRGEVLEACAVLRANDPGNGALAADLRQLVKRPFAAHAYPGAVHFIEELPKTPSGKVPRYAALPQRRAEVAPPPPGAP
ncbi:AMP-binding enzyme [Deinococcus hopiensis]|uniref:AMP-binding enzyme n=1 Tax=Deinococcus hopiensis TaxID=309885 RepID=UPI0031830D4F